MLDENEVLENYKNLDYFKPLSPEVMSEIMRITQVVQYDKGSEILRQDEPNTRLFFLMEGTVDVLVDQGKVASLSSQGDLLGEISLIRKDLCTATIIAKTNTTLCFIEISELSSSKENERIEHVFYQIYANILSIKIKDTNDKAKYFESLVFELEGSKDELFKLNQSLENKVVTKTKVLVVDPSKKQQNIAKIAISSCGSELTSALTIDEGMEIIRSSSIDIVFVSLDSIEILQKIENENINITVVVMTSGEIKDYINGIGENKKDVHFMSRNEHNKSFTIKNFTSTINKLSTHDFFGIHKYMPEGAEIFSRKVNGSAHRHNLNTEMTDYFTKIGVRKSNISRVNTVAEELLMNAIYDAPHDSQGKAIYNHLPRTEKIDLKDNEKPILTYGCDGIIVAVSLQDPFGAISSNTIFKYLASCYNDSTDLNDTKNKGGAGRGLHQIIEGSDLVVFNITAGKKTEIISIFHVDPKDTMENQKSFHIFYS